MAATLGQYVTNTAAAVDTGDWLTGSNRSFIDVLSGNVCQFTSSSNFGTGTIELWQSSGIGVATTKISTGAPNRVSPYPDLLLGVAQSSDGFVHAILSYNNLSFFQYYYTRYRLTRSGTGQVTGYLVDQQPIALPVHSIDATFDMRAVIFIGLRGGVECPFYGWQASAGGDATYVHYAGRITGTSGQTGTVGLDGTGQDTLIYSRAVTANTRNHNIQFLLVQELTSEDIYGITGAFNSDYYLGVAQNAEWNILGIRWARSGANWASGSTTTIYTVPSGGADQPQVMQTFSVAGKACLCYYTQAAGLAVGYFDSSGTWNAWRQLSSTTAQAYFAAFWTNGTIIFGAYNRYNANGVTSNGAFVYHDGTTLTSTADSAPANTESYYGSTGSLAPQGGRGLVAMRGTPGDTLGQTRTGDQTAFAFLPAPTITQQPSNQVVQSGGTATFIVAATASGGSLSYQWQIDTGSGWTNAGTNSTSYALASGSNGTLVSVLVTDGNDTLRSSTAVLSVLAAGPRYSGGIGAGPVGAAPVSDGRPQGVTSPDIAVNLSGSAVTVSTGSIALELKPAVSGSAITSTAGSLAVALSKALAGEALALSLGTLVPGFSKGLSGDLVTANTGTLALAVSKALVGESLLSLTGSLDPAVSKTLAGEILALAGGTLSPAISKSLVGEALTLSTGAITPSVAFSLAGTTLTLSLGSIAVASGVNLSGQLLGTATGVLSVGVAKPLTGELLTLNTGELIVMAGGNITLTLTGTNISLNTGSLSLGLAKGLSGASIGLSAGQVSVAQGIPLSGSQLTAAAGQLAAVLGISLSGAQVLLSTGALTVSMGGDVTLTLTGVSLSTVVGSLSVAHALTLAGQDLALQTGIIEAQGPAGPLPIVPYAAPEGLAASDNPWGSSVGGEGPLSAGSNGLIIGRFAWIDPTSMTASNSWALGQVLGFVPVIQSSYMALYLSTDRLLRLRAGYAASLISFGDFWARFSLGAQAGDRVYASVIDGAPISGQAVDAMPTPWKVATSCEPGGLSIITTWSL